MTPRQQSAAYGRSEDETQYSGDPAIGAAAGQARARHGELERRLAEQARRIADLEAFAATVAHQLAEPLVIAESNAIFFEDELGDVLNDITRDRLRLTARVSARARLLIETLLMDARSDQPIRRRPVDSRRLVEETLQLFSDQIAERGIAVRVEPLPNVEADPDLLRVVYQNLISNALRHGARSGAIGLQARREPDAWRFSVISGGPPLGPEDAERIFEPFARAAGERRRAGYGLGLPICRSIVERHGGRMGVTPLAESGNAFWFVLPG
jgi:signal transduction histidine kinase